MTTTKSLFYGWDIGGAHLKVAYADHSGLLQVIQLHCELWRGIEALETAFATAIQQLPDMVHAVHAVTMTGELVDAFQHRQQGVERILHCVSALLPVNSTQVYAGQKGWLSIANAIQQWESVASMNWQASAHYVAQQLANGLFVDIGSTTCDLIAFEQHQIQPQGLSDFERQRHCELVYTGAIRTPLMALATSAPLQGSLISLSAEWFASSADIWLLLDKLNPADIQDNSADGQAWDKPCSAQRLARMLGTDASHVKPEEWRLLAQWFAEKQLQRITEACLTVLSAHPNLPTDSPLIGAGVGQFIVAECAKRLGRDYLDFSQFCSQHPSAGLHAPAAALALLAQQQLA